MQSGYYSSAAGMVTQFNRLDTIANNLANVNTIGYKEDNLVVGDFMRLYKEARDELPNENHSKEASKFLNRTLTRAPQIVDSYTDFSTGDLQVTGNTYDMALAKDGLFFLVETPQGPRFTRDGAFSVDNDGKLVTKDGYKVLPNDYFKSGKDIEIPEEVSILEIDKNGQINQNLPGSVKFSLGSKLFIAQPDNVNLLVKEGNGLYRYDGTDKLESLEESGALRQGFVEKSNVNAVSMMTKMIETNRLVGMYQKAMQVQMNDMNQDLINKIARKT